MAGLGRRVGGAVAGWFGGRRERGRRHPDDGVTGGRLRVDMAMCDGYGVCAELLPELVALDDWGYPIVADRAVPPPLTGHVRRAVRLCPRMALSVLPAGAGRPGRKL